MKLFKKEKQAPVNSDTSLDVSEFDVDGNEETNEQDLGSKSDTAEDDNVAEKETDDNTEKEKAKNLILYIIIDRGNESLLGYYRDCGISVSKIFTDLSEAKDTLLMQIDPTKVIIVDTGTGRFSNVGTRKELIDLMGICDEDARISYYFTDTVIRSELQYDDSFESRNIHWHKYKSTADIVAHLLMNVKNSKENYIYDENDKDEVAEACDNILDFTGFKFKEQEHLDAGEPSIGINEINTNMVNNLEATDAIPGFKIKKI